MARAKKKAAPKPNGGGDNLSAMAAEIRAVCEDLNAIDNDDDAIRARHKTDLAPIKKRRKAVKGRVKALGIDQHDIDYWRRIYDETDEHKTETLSNIAAILPSLDIGETVDWVKALLGDKADVRPNFLRDRENERAAKEAEG